MVSPAAGVGTLAGLGIIAGLSYSRQSRGNASDGASVTYNRVDGNNRVCFTSLHIHALMLLANPMLNEM
jgi:hypothetical protein